MLFFQYTCVGDDSATQQTYVHVSVSGINCPGGHGHINDRLAVFKRLV